MLNTLRRPNQKQFKAGRILPVVPKWLTLKHNVLEYWAATKVVIEDDRDYRYVETGADEVLLITPKGLDTQTLKVELYLNGWVKFGSMYPDFKFVKKVHLGLCRVTPETIKEEPTLVFARSIKSGDLRKSGIVYPRVAVMGQRNE